MRGHIREAAPTAAPNKEQNRRDEQQQKRKQRQIQRVAHNRRARITLTVDALLDQLEERYVEYEDGERRGAGKAAEAGGAAVGDGRAEEREEGEGEGDERDAEGDDVQDEDLGERRGDCIDARGERWREGPVDELRHLRQVVPDLRGRALLPAPVLQVGTESERAEVDERVRLVRGSGGRGAIAQVDAQEVYGLEVWHIEGHHSEERRRGCDGRHAEDFVPGNHWIKATERRERKMGSEICPVLRQ